MNCYVAALWNRGSPEQSIAVSEFRAALKASSSRVRWSILVDIPGMLVAHQPRNNHCDKFHLLSNERGAIVGELFHRESHHPANTPEQFGQAESERIINGGGRYLIDRYWGSYVAFLAGDSGHTLHAIRGPAANLPCYRLDVAGVHFLFSHIGEAFRFLPTRLEPHRTYLSEWLVLGSAAAPHCCLAGIEQLRSGTRFTLSKEGVAHTTLWNPLTIAASPLLLSQRDAADNLRTVVQDTVSTWASRFRAITLKLSGGLDSSIVAGCLAHAPSRPKVNYLNFAIDASLHEARLHMPGVNPTLADKVRSIASHGDERHFARMVAQRWGNDLIERWRDTAINLSRTWTAPLTVNPSEYFTSIEGDDAEIWMARELGTQAFFSGQGGDSVFLATLQPLPAMDYAYLHGMRGEFFKHIMDTALLCRESVWTVLFLTLKHGLLKRRYRPPFNLSARPHLLCDDVVLEVSRRAGDEQLSLGHRIPPGKSYHAGAAGSSFHEFVFHSQRYAAHVDPLNSQPVWEAVLRLPTYSMLANGASRGLARAAFADLLPPEIRKRQTKGSGTSFYQHVVRRNSSLLAEQLLEGQLTRQGLLDRAKLQNFFAAPEPFVVMNAAQVLSYWAAEVWLQRWLAIGCRPASDLESASRVLGA